MRHMRVHRYIVTRRGFSTWCFCDAVHLRGVSAVKGPNLEETGPSLGGLNYIRLVLFWKRKHSDPSL